MTPEEKKRRKNELGFAKCLESIAKRIKDRKYRLDRAEINTPISDVCYDGIHLQHEYTGDMYLKIHLRFDPHGKAR